MEWNLGFAHAFMELGHTSAQLALLGDRVQRPYRTAIA
jgi:hypothetical protein